jgi:small nuclear ribonucleoprotein (snRNP)-like protein
MLKQTISFALAAGLLFAAAARPAHARPQGEKEARRVEELKERAEKFCRRGTRRVEVRLKDGRKLKGRVVETAETDFVLADAKTGTESTIRYEEVKQFKLDRPGYLARGLVMFGGTVGLLAVFLLVAHTDR